MSVESFIKEWENVSDSVENGVRSFNGVTAKIVATGWNNTIKVQSVRSASKKQGNATALFKKLVALAKEHNVSLRLTAQNLTPWKQSSMNRGELVRWLSKTGFKPLFMWPDGFGTEMVSR